MNQVISYKKAPIELVWSFKGGGIETLHKFLYNRSHIDQYLGLYYDWGHTPLSLAAELGDVATIKVFLEYNFDGQQHSPVYYTAKKGHTHAIKLLVEYIDNQDSPGPLLRKE